MATETRQQRRRRERIQRERQRRQKVKVASSATTIPSPKGEHPSIRAWHIALGIPAAFVATGIGLAATGATYFWIGSYLAYVGIAWLLVDWWLFSKTLVMQTRLLGTTGTLIIAGIVTWMSFRPGIAPVFVELCEAGVAVNDVKRLSRFGQERSCLFPFRSERQARPARQEAACRLSACESLSWLRAWPQQSSARPSRANSSASHCG